MSSKQHLEVDETSADGELKSTKSCPEISGNDDGYAVLLQKRNSFKKQESFGKGKTKTSFEGSFFMDFYFSQGDYQLEANKIAKEQTIKEKLDEAEETEVEEKKAKSKAQRHEMWKSMAKLSLSKEAN